MCVPAMAGETEAAVPSGKKYVIATDTVFKPFEYTDDKGDFVGIDVDILAAIAKDQGFDYELKSLGWDSAIAACQAGQADGMIAGASITDERKKSGWMFSDGYFNATQSLTVKEDSDIAGFDDLKGKTVGVKTGTQGASYAESLKEQYGFSITYFEDSPTMYQASYAESLKEQYGFSITYFEDSPTMYQAVLGGQVVGCFEDTPIMLTSIKEGKLALKVLDNTQNEGSPYGFAVFNKDEQALVDLFNAGLKDIKADGTYAEIITKYLGADAVPSETEADTEASTEAE